MYAFALSNTFPLSIPSALTSSFPPSTAFGSLLTIPSSAALTRFQEAASSPDAGLTFQEVVESLPTDLGSLVVLALLAGFVGFVVYYGQKPSSPKTKAPQDPTEPEKPSVP